MTLANLRTLHRFNSRRQHIPDCPRCAQDDLIDAIRGSRLWDALQTPMSKLIDQLREENKQCQ